VENKSLLHYKDEFKNLNLSNYEAMNLLKHVKSIPIEDKTSKETKEKSNYNENKVDKLTNVIDMLEKENSKLMSNIRT